MKSNIINNNTKMRASATIFNNNLRKNSKTILLKRKLGDVGMTKYLPSFSKE
jgi:hypothetical protein